jgi:hypothetical protein
MSPVPISLLHRTAFLALLLIVSAASCRDPIFQEMSDSTYVNTMVALRKLPIGGDSVSRARQRDSILRVFGVTARDLEAISNRLSDNPELAGTIYRAIENPPVSEKQEDRK